MTLKKNGGMWFWTIGRIGGSVYRKRLTWQDKVRMHYDSNAKAESFLLGALLAANGWLLTIV
jgi:hypothetical protein